MYFGRDIWDPLLIVSQLVVNQFSFYLVLSTWLILFSTLGGLKVSLDSIVTFHFCKFSTFDGQVSLQMIFSSRAVSFSTLNAWSPICAYILTIPVAYDEQKQLTLLEL